MLRQDALEPLDRHAESFIPSTTFLLTVATDQRRRKPFIAIDEVPSETALDTKELAIESGMVAVVGSDDLIVANGKGRLAAVATVIADRPRIGHLPGPGVIAIGPAGERTHRAYINAHPALFAFQLLSAIGNNLAMRAAETDTVGVDVHSLIAYPDASEAEDAAWPIVIDKAGELLFLVVELGLHEAGLSGPVPEDGVLELTFSALVANRTIQGVVSKQELEHGLPSILHFLSLGVHHHAIGHYRSTGGLQLGHPLDCDQTHAAGALQGQVRVIAVRGYLDT